MNVRELVTVLGFQVDETKLKRFDGMILATERKLEGLERIQNRVLGFLGAAVAARGAAAFLQLTAQVEGNQVAFQTLLKDGEKAKAMLADIYTFAKETPFGIFDTSENAKRLLAFGFAAEKIIPTLRTVGDAVSALGTGNAGLDRITYALGQIQTKGRLMTQEMNQLSESFIGGWKYLAEGLGKTEAQVMDMTEKRLIDSETALRLIMEGIQRDFGGGMAARMKTLGGQWDMLKQSMQNFFISLGAGKFGQSMTRMLTGLNRWFDENADTITKFAQIAGSALGLIVDNAGLVVAALTAITATGLILWVQKLAQSLMLLWANPPALIFLAIAAAIFAVIVALNDLWVWIKGGDSLFGALFGDFQKYADAFRAVLGYFAPEIRVITAAFNGLWEVGSSIVRGLGNAFSGLFKAIVGGFKSMWAGVKSIVPDFVWNFLKEQNSEYQKNNQDASDGLKTGYNAAGKAMFGDIWTGKTAAPAFAGGGARGGDMNITVNPAPGTPKEQLDFIRIGTKEIFANEKAQIMVNRPRREQ